MHPVTLEEIRKLDSILSNGLCYGGGDGTTTFCAEQAVALVCGLPVTDHPDECAEPACSAFGRRLNDSTGWGTDQDRARGMRPFLIAQLGSAGVVSGREFADRLVLRTIREVLPIWLRHGKIDEALVVACEQATDLPAARVACLAARKADAAAAAAPAAAAAAAYAAAYAAAAHAADAYAYAYAYADAARKVTLPLAVKIATEILIELKSPGAALLEPDWAARSAGKEAS